MRPLRREPIYTAAIGAGRLLFGGVLRLGRTASGLHNLPDSGGAVLAITHFGYLDFALTEWVVWNHNRRRIRFMAMQAAFDKPLVGWLLRGMRHIPVNMSAGAEAYASAVKALKSGELLGVFPEGGVSSSFTVRELKTGAIRMAAEAGVPLIPVSIWGGHFLKTKHHKARWSEAHGARISITAGEAIIVPGDADAASRTRELRMSLQTMLDEQQEAYPMDGRGKWWQPAHLGGAAPTPEVAAVAEAERQRRKAERRASAEQ